MFLLWWTNGHFLKHLWHLIIVVVFFSHYIILKLKDQDLSGTIVKVRMCSYCGVSPESAEYAQLLVHLWFTCIPRSST